MHWFALQYVKSAEDAHEIVNDAFMVLWEKKEDLQIDSGIKPLLYTIVRNKSINFLKKKKLDVADLDASLEFVSTEISPLDILQVKETETAVFALIETLPPRCKQIFVLSRKEQLSNKQIAELMELSEKTIENQISIAIKLIREGLRKTGQGNKNYFIFFPWLLSSFLAETLIT